MQEITITENWFIFVDGVELDADEYEPFARGDGFDSFHEMMEFWEGRLPFTGHIIHWRMPA